LWQCRTIHWRSDGLLRGDDESSKFQLKGMLVVSEDLFSSTWLLVVVAPPTLRMVLVHHRALASSLSPHPPFPSVASVK
jgi:hypothetical protein